MITTYKQFCRRVEENGFMTFTRNPWNASSLEREVQGSVWSDELPDPPWEWKNRIAEEKIALYGHALGGRNVFISMKWLPLFFAVNWVQDDIEMRYLDGEVDNLSIRIVRELRAFPCQNKFSLRTALGMSGKKKGKLENALYKLEREMVISIGASAQKKNKEGCPYGWPSNEIWLCEAYYAEQLAMAMEINREDAKKCIAERICEHGGYAEWEDKLLFRS